LTWLLAVVIATVSAQAISQMSPGFDDDVDSKPWQEIEAQLPPYPRSDNLIEFYVSAATPNRFFIDASSISVGGDDVVRYALLVRSPSGTTTVSFEGMRCNSAEVKLYAFGHGDNTWSKARASAWKQIRESSLNRHHAALYNDYLCVGRAPVSSAAEALGALRRGGHQLFQQPSR
jgi:hypothetical protein